LSAASVTQWVSGLRNSLRKDNGYDVVFYENPAYAHEAVFCENSVNAYKVVFCDNLEEALFMLNLLIVDDEFYAVEAIVQGVQWSELNITGVLQAYSVATAKERFRANDIHILIADIEMPGEDGLELLEWVNLHYPHVQTIFLTAHSNFQYAQKALQLGSFDYIVKPIDKKRLSKVIEQAVEAVRKDQGLVAIFKNYEQYLALWNSNRPLLTESFWQQVVDQHISVQEASMLEYFKLYEIPFSPDKPVLALLFHIDYWDQEFSLRDMKVLQYAIKNAAAELLDGGEGIQVFYDRQDHLFVLLPVGYQHIDRQEMRQRCVRFMDACRTYFYSELSCYISEAIPYKELPLTCRKLLEMERSNVTRLHPVQWHKEFSLSPMAVTVFELTWLPELQELLEAGNTEGTKQLLDEMFTRLERSDHVTNETLQTIYYSILFMMVDLAQKHGVEAGSLYGGLARMDQAEATRTLLHCKKWTFDISETILKLQGQGRERNLLIDKIHLFIDQHLCEEFSREDIANHVHLNPVYVSRLYKKETGYSLTDYILEKRMERAQKYLVETSYKVTSIMEMIGYQSFSHFTQMFKKVYKMTPQEYRKSHRNLL
jgi:two-component system response regulator YesN